jgi:hypothetical protein
MGRNWLRSVTTINGTLVVQGGWVHSHKCLEWTLLKIITKKQATPNPPSTVPQYLYKDK